MLHIAHDVAKDPLPSTLRATLTSILSCSSLDLEFLLIKRPGDSNSSYPVRNEAQHQFRFSVLTFIYAAESLALKPPLLIGIS